jgi:hypothetical protein
VKPAVKITGLRACIGNSNNFTAMLVSISIFPSVGQEPEVNAGTGEGVD